MAQCVYLEPDGGRCPHQAEEGFSLCRWHIRLMEEAEQPGSRLRRQIFRLAALLLLSAFLLPLAVEGYRLLKIFLN